MANHFHRKPFYRTGRFFVTTKARSKT